MRRGAHACRLEIRDLSQLERLGLALERFAQQHGMAAKDVSAIGLAVDEMVSNVLHYASEGGKGPVVVVHAHAADGLLSVEIEDRGRPFDPTSAPRPDITAPIEERPVGGLGIHIARSLVDTMTYRRRDERNVVTLTKRFAPGVAAAIADRDAMPLDESESDGVVVFALGGRLGVDAAASLERRLRARLEGGTRRFVFDCAHLAWVGSAGVRVLLIAAKETSARGGAVALASPGAAVSQTIEIAGLTSLLPSYPNREEAVAALAQS